MFFAFAVFAAWTLSSCSSKKFLQDGEYLLKRNDIKIESPYISGDEKARLKEIAAEGIALKPNSNYFFGIPKERAALKYRFESDTPAVTAFIMKRDGERPAFIDSTRLEAVSKNLANLIEEQGYYDATVDYEILFDKNKKLIPVRYTIYPGKLYTLDSFDIVSQDTALLREIDSLDSRSHLRKGAAVSKNLRTSESERITNALRDIGYYDFSPSQFSKFIASDTTDQLVDLNFNIYPPSDGSAFKKYTIGEVYIYPGYDADIPFSEYQDTLIGAYHFRTTDGDFIVRPKFVTRKLSVRPGDTYSYKEFRQTILQLNNLDIFKTPRIRIRKRDDGSAILDYHILLFKEKKYEDEAGIENFFSSIAANTTLIGVSLDARRRIRNAFNGSETVSVNLSGSAETALKKVDSDNNILNIGIGLNVSMPRYTDLGTFGFARATLPGMRKHVLTNEFLNDLSNLGEQQLNLSFSYVDFAKFYSATTFKFSRGVSLRRRNHTLNFVFQDFDLFLPDTGVDFTERIGDNELFRRSFTRQLITGFLFRSIDYAYSSPLRNKQIMNLNASAEVSGFEVSLFDWAFKDADLSTLRVGSEKIRFSQFFKFEVEPKWTYFFSDKTSLAMRLGVGIAFPYAKGKQVPYGELFSLGGSYSLRGWRNRDIGPGILNQSNTSIPFSADQFKFEISSEYRFDLGWIIEGALFAEAGNVWSVSKDPTTGVQNPKTRINIKSIAMDAGLGIRFDLTFFLFRFDMAFPVRNWYPDANGNHWNTGSFKKLTKNPNYVIGINYPF